MYQYTLLITDEKKVVKMKVFNTMRELLDYKRYILDKKIDLKQVDRYGYVWFYESEEEE